MARKRFQRGYVYLDGEKWQGIHGLATPMNQKTEKTEALASGQKSFDPRARLVSVLGEQLIRDETVGLLELVKNAYDADASVVQVRIGGTKRLESTQVVVQDNGSGMDRQTILGRWFEPATGEKEREKSTDIRTRKFKRLPLGEKGVGRFAAHRLGRKLLMISRVEEGRTEVVVNVEWDKFDEREKYLREVQVDWEERSPTFFSDSKHGTYLLMSHARTLWTENEVKKLANALKRLMSPFRPPADFRVTLSCPDFPKYQDLDPGDLLNRSHAQFHGVVDEHGNLDFEYSFKLPGLSERTAKGDADLRLTLRTEDWGKPDREPQCGPFFLSFHLWHRTAGVLQLTGTSRADLDAAAGVSVFRDGLRVLPYGEADDDWLSLDEERYLRPTEAIGRKTIVGAVEILQQANGGLRDKTNREGFIENRAFRDFQLLVKAAIGILEKEWSADKETIEGKRKQQRRPSARPALDAFAAKTEEFQQALRTSLDSANELAQAVKDGRTTPEMAASLASSLQLLSGQIPKVQQTTATTKDTLDEAADELEHERDLLLGLAGLGLAAERFTHEFARLTREAHQILLQVENTLKMRDSAVTSALDALRAIIDALRNDIKALGPMFYVRRATKEKELSVRAAIENAKLLNATAFADAHVQFETQGSRDFTVLMREGPLTQVFNNLFDNAAFWLSRKSDERNRKLRVCVDADKREILVTDNGPGVFQRYKDRIFRPFFSMKADGRGLGLYIAREILGERSAEILLLENGDHPGAFPSGASFLVRFPEIKREHS